MYTIPGTMHDEQFIEELIDLMSRDAKESVVSALKLKIPGFTSKNYKKIPDALLITQLKKALHSFKNANILYISAIQYNEEKYSNLELHEFVMKMDNDEKKEPFEKYILITYYFPTFYEEQKEQLFNSLKRNRKIGQLLSSRNPSEIIKIKTNLVSKDIFQKVNNLFKNKITSEEIKDTYTNKDDLNIYFLKILRQLYSKRNDIQIADPESVDDWLHIQLLFIHEIVNHTEKIMKDKV